MSGGFIPSLMVIPLAAISAKNFSGIIAFASSGMSKRLSSSDFEQEVITNSAHTTVQSA